MRALPVGFALTCTRAPPSFECHRAHHLLVLSISSPRSFFTSAIKMTRTKPEASQPSFLLLTRWSFRHPKLTSRDVAAIEYQVSSVSPSLASPSYSLYIVPSVY